MRSGSFQVHIPIGALQQSAAVGRDTANQLAIKGSQAEVLRGPHGNMSNMCPPRLVAGWHGRFDQIARLEVCHKAAAFGGGTWKAVLVHAAHLAILTTGGCDVEGTMSIGNIDLFALLTETRRIGPVGFRITPLGAVVFGASAGGGQNRDTTRRKPMVEQPSRGIDRGSILEGVLCLSLNIGIAKLGSSAVALARVAVVTGQRQVREPNGTTDGAGNNMFNLQR